MRSLLRSALLAAALALGAGGCGGDSESRIADVERGMTKDEVRTVMGEPDDVHTDPEGTARFGLECWSWGARWDTDAIVCFAGHDPARVIEIREAPPATTGAGDG
jgi:hypothetical protein